MINQWTLIEKECDLQRRSEAWNRKRRVCSLDFKKDRKQGPYYRVPGRRQDNIQLLLHKFKVIKLRGSVKRDIWKKKATSPKPLGYAPLMKITSGLTHTFTYLKSHLGEPMLSQRKLKMRAYKVFPGLLSYLCDEEGCNDPLAAKHWPKSSFA